MSLKRKVQSLSALDAVFESVSVRQTIASGGSLADTVAISEETKAQLAPPLPDLKPDLENVVSGLVMMGDFVCVTGFNKPHLWIYSSAKNDKKQNLHSDTLVVTDFNKKLHMVQINKAMDITKNVAKNLSFLSHGVSVDFDQVLWLEGSWFVNRAHKQRRSKS